MNTGRKLLVALCRALIACLTAPAALQAVPGVMAQAASGVKLNKTKATVYNGQTLKLKVSGTSKAVTWSTSDGSVAKVSRKGVVTAKGVGKATITAAVGGKKLACAVTVKSPLWADATELKLKAGKSKKVTVTYKFAGKITMKCDDASVVTCKLGKLKNGKCTLTVKAIRAGETVITIKNSKTKDVVRIRAVVTGTEPTDPIVDKTRITLEKGKSETVRVTWPYAGVPYLVWDDDSVVQCAWGDWNGKGWPLTVKGIGPGSAHVLLYRGEGGEKVATISVTVKQ